DGLKAIQFYKSAFGAAERHIYKNDDGTVHVAELSIDGVIFHIREVSPEIGHFNPLAIGGISALIELWVNDPSSVFSQALAAGATQVNPVKDHAETGYRQGTLIDPFGHKWHIMRPL